MFSIPGIVGLLVFIYIRPQEFIEPLQKVPFLYVFCLMAIAGFVIDIRLRLLKPGATPILPFAVGYVIWCLLTVFLKAEPAVAIGPAIELCVAFLIYFVIAHSIQKFRTLLLLAAVVCSLGLFLTWVGVEQGLSEWGCAQMDPANPAAGIPDGRTCKPEFYGQDCLGFDAEPGATYTCERVGLFGTTSIHGRVRYRGKLQDPNELSLTVCITVIPIMIAFATRRRSLRFWAVAAAAIFAVLVCVIMTQSRGGQLVFLGVIGVYFVKRYGIRGAGFGFALAVPVLLMGGRSDSAADESTMQRYEAWSTGLQMFRADPVFGVGYSRFVDHHYLTAHNSYVLAPAETGFLGMVLWSTLIYLSIKTLIVGQWRLRATPGAQVARDWGLALTASMAGLLIQMTFLSFAYHPVLWTFLGLCGAYYSAVKSHDPSFEVGFRLRDLALVVAIDIALLIGIFVVVRLKNF